MTRARRHAAVLIAIFAVSVFGYLLLEPRNIRVQADGREVSLETLHSNDAAVLGGAGINVEPGDRVVRDDAPGADRVLRIERARHVTLHVDGLVYELRTHAETIDQLFDEANVQMDDRDSVLQNGALVAANAPVEPPVLVRRGNVSPENYPEILIELRRAVPFVIEHDGVAIDSSTSRVTVAQALREAAVVVGPGDRVVPALDAQVTRDLRIEVRSARAVTVALPGEHRVIYTFERTVGEALAAEGIPIPESAYIEPGPEALVEAGQFVRVVQLSAGQDEEREYIASQTVLRVDTSLRAGQTRTVEGHDGVLVRRYDIGYANGEEANRILIEEFLETEPVDTIVYYPPPVGEDASVPTDAPGRTVRVYATWYNAASSGRPASDPAYGHTATGVIVTYGVVAVDPSVIPLGTCMFIPGYGYGVAADTGGAVKGYIIDLGYPDDVTSPWASKWMDIYILDRQGSCP